MANSELLELALDYHRQGFCVVPAHPRGKAPAPDSWVEYQTRMSTEEEIRHWWSDSSPNYNIGAVTGKISRIVVIDVDDPEALSQLRPHRSWKIAASGEPGHYHLYYRYPTYTDHVPNKVRFMDGVDARGDGGYIILPGSVHPNGGVYSWSMDGEMPEFPKPLFEALSGKVAVKVSEKTSWVADLLENGSKEGSRDADATKLSGYLVGLKMPTEVVLAILRQWYEKTDKHDFPWTQVQKCLTSVQRKNDSKIVTSFSLNVYPFDQYLTNDTSIRWLVEDWFPEASMGMMVAPPGSFKTWLMLYLCVSIATGLPFLGKYATKRRPVLLVQVEDGHAILRRRLKLILADLYKSAQPITLSVEGDEFFLELPPCPDMDIFKVDSLPSFEDPAFMEALKEKIASRKYGLVAFDPLYTLVNMDDYMAKAAKSMMPLKALRDEFGVSFMVLHHTKKRSGEDGDDLREMAWGSQFINAWLEQGFQVRRPKGETDDRVIVVHRHSKMAGKSPPIRMRFDINTSSLDEDAHMFAVQIQDYSDEPTAIPEEFSEADATTRDIQAISALIVSRGGVIRIKDIEVALSMPKSTCSKRIKQMVNRGLLVKDTNGAYSWAG